MFISARCSGWRPGAAVSAVWSFAVWALLAVPLATAQQPTPLPGEVDIQARVPYDVVNPEWEDCGLRPYDMPGRIGKDGPMDMRRTPPENRTQTATIVVDYGSGFTPEAQRAFQRAVDIWETHIASPVPIRIAANFSPLGENVLGGARPNEVLVADVDGVDGSRVYGDALVDAIKGVDQNPGQPDILISFNSEFAAWHFGEEAAPANEIDFTGVVLHEIGHGLGYFDSFFYNEGTGLYGIDLNGNGFLDDGEGIPGIFGSFLVEDQNGARLPITDTAFYPNISEELGDALTGSSLFFDGPFASEGAQISTGPEIPRVYAPSPWNPGSSIAHLDELTYRPGDVNSLMTPRIGAGETERSPGPVMCGQFADIGWTLGRDCQDFFRSVFSIEGTPTAEGASFTFTWQTTPDANIQSYAMQQSTFGGPFETVRTLDGSATSATVRDVGLGEFAFRMQWVNGDGETVTAEPVEATYNIQDINAEVLATTDLGRGDVAVRWSVPRGTEGFTYTVQRAPGQGQGNAFRTVQENISGTEATLSGQQPGRYTYRILATDANGNALQSDTQRITVDFEGDVYILGPFPNPTTGAATVELTSREFQNVQIEIFNSIGQRLLFEERSLPVLTPSEIAIPGERWASGMYFIRVTGNDFVETEQFVVL